MSCLEIINLTDLRIFVSAASRPSLAAAAIDMHLTPSAVSKALRRLEESLGTPLFDRSAKQLVLNDSGQRLLARARPLLALADQTKADVMGEAAAVECRLGGPALLLWRHGQGASEALRAWPKATLSLQAMFEDEALAALARGDINGALVTGEVVGGRGAHWSAQWEATPLGELKLQLAAGKTHPLSRKKKGGVVQASSTQVLEHDFACPPRSLFCGVRRGARSDGWHDDQQPRKIKYWTDDLKLLLGFVRSGAALAYLPDFALAESDLVRIDLTDGAFQCTEQAFLVWNKTSSAEWQRALTCVLATQSDETATITRRS